MSRRLCNFAHQGEIFVSTNYNESKIEKITAKPVFKTVRMWVNIKNVKYLNLKENPPTQRFIAS